jgi:Zn-dependent protease
LGFLAKPVPVNFSQLRQPHRDRRWVAAAGPAMNIALAIGAALLVHALGFPPTGADRWFLSNLSNAININVFRWTAGVSPSVAPPNVLARPAAALEPFGMMIMIGVFFLLPTAESQARVHISLFANLVTRPANAIIHMIWRLLKGPAFKPQAPRGASLLLLLHR